MNQLIEQGIAKGLISFDTDQKNIAYKVQNKRFRLSDPEEKVAEDIGYDATGRPTAINELETVAGELGRFVAHIEQGDKRPFA